MRSLASRAEPCPSTDSRPESGNRIDMIMRIVVVLPAPLGPMKPYSAPRGTTGSRRSTAVVPPNVFLTPSSSIAVFTAIGLSQESAIATGDRDNLRHRVPVARRGRDAGRGFDEGVTPARLRRGFDSEQRARVF